MSKDIRYTGPKKEIEPSLGDNLETAPIVGSPVRSSYANKDWLSDQLVSLIAETNLFVSDLERDLVEYALPVTEDPADIKLKEAHSAEWPRETLGAPRNVVTYRYYKALELRDSSAAAYIRKRYEEAARDVTGVNSIDLVSLTKIVRNEAFLAQEFVSSNVGNLDDSSEHRTVELLQDWVTAATEHTGKLRVLFQTRNTPRKLPDAEVEQITPEEARNAQALFKVNLNKLNGDLDNNIAFLKKNFTQYAHVFYTNFLIPALEFRNKVSAKVYPILPGRLGREVNVATSAVDNQLTLVLADQTRRNMLFDEKFKELTTLIEMRDTYRSYIKQLGDKGKSIESGTVNTMVEETDTPEEVEVFEEIYSEMPDDPNALELATPTGQFTAPHGSLTGTDATSAHPQYVLKAGDAITGSLTFTTGATVDGVDIDLHDHDGVGSKKVKGTNIEGGTLPVGAIDTSQTPGVPTNFKLVGLTQTQVPPGVTVFDALFSWEGDDEHTFEMQIVPVRAQ